MKMLTSAAACLLLAACGFTPQGDFARDTISTRGAQAYDSGIDNAIWWLCYGTSVGSVKRKFGATPGAGEAYNALCALDSTTPMPFPEEINAQ